MKIKLVAIDLDDTLLRDDLSISEHSRAVIKAVRANGVIVTLATGRMFPSAVPYARTLGFDVPLITYQGALVKNALSEETVYRQQLSKEVCCKVIEIARAREIQLNFYLNDRLYIEQLTSLGAHYPKLAGVPYTQVSDLKDLLNKGCPLKLLLIEKEDLIEDLALELKRAIGNKAHVTRSKPRYLEVVHTQATKAHALRKLAAYLEIPREKVMAFGDSFNDLEMLDFAGLSVAVANAHPEVKAHAAHITFSNNDDGVAAALETFILNNN